MNEKNISRNCLMKTGIVFNCNQASKRISTVPPGCQQEGVEDYNECGDKH